MRWEMHPKEKGVVSGKGKVLSLTVPSASGFFPWMVPDLVPGELAARSFDQ